MAKMYSDDKQSGINGGRLPKFNQRRFLKPFTDVAFSLEKEGEVSKPFQTPFGWHIIKLIKKYPVDDFEVMKANLQSRIESSDRSYLSGKSVIDSLIHTYKIEKNIKVINAFLKKDTALLNSLKNDWVYKINGNNSTLGELVQFAKPIPERERQEVLNDFFSNSVLEYYKAHLEDTSPEFAFSLQEYKDGLLLFNILEDKIWKRAQNDSTGLQSFFEGHRSDYMWPKRGDIIVATCSKLEKAAIVKQLLEKNVELDSIRKQVNENAIVHVLFTKGIMEEGNNRLPQGFKIEYTGVSDPIKQGNNDYVVVKVNAILAPEAMQFAEARGKVMNDYQDFLEKQWIEVLKEKYPVKVNKRVLKKIKKNL